MGARKQTDLTPEQYAVADALYDLQIEAWRDISLEAREAAARACYPAVIIEQIEQLPADPRLAGAVRPPSALHLPNA